MQVIAFVVMAFLAVSAIWFVVQAMRAFESELECYQCGKQFTPDFDTPIPTASWGYDFCSDGCKNEYRLTRI
jgi:hypothetical protein